MKKLLQHGKRAEMGIGFLIIFLALILIAAIAATVLLTTVQNLQQKALLTGSRTKGEIATFLQTLNFYAEDGLTGNLTYFCSKNTLGPGSDPLSFANILIEFDTDIGSSDKVLGVEMASDVDNTAWVSSGMDLDNDESADTVLLGAIGSFATGQSPTHLIFNITNSSSQYYLWVPLLDGVTNLSAATTAAPIYLNVFDAQLNYSSSADSILGTVSIVGRTDVANTIPTDFSHIFLANVGQSGAYSLTYLHNGTSHANGFLVRGDIALICFAGPNPVGPEEEISVRYIPKIGHVALIATATPDVYTSKRMYIFP